jgi:hypothetical protein
VTSGLAGLVAQKIRQLLDSGALVVVDGQIIPAPVEAPPTNP